MKRNIVFLAVIALMTFTLAAMAASPVIKVRVVNVDVLGMDEVTTDAGLAKTATMSMAENPQIFPPIESMIFTVGKDQVKYQPDVTVPAGGLKFSGSIGEKEMFEFISIANPDTAGKFDGAVVSRDGTVTHIDDEIVIDYLTRSIDTPRSFVVKDGDVLLLFIKNSDPNPIGHEKPEKEYNQREHQNPTHDPRNKG
jgi:hypothetical protein